MGAALPEAALGEAPSGAGAVAPSDAALSCAPGRVVWTLAVEANACATSGGGSVSSMRLGAGGLSIRRFLLPRLGELPFAACMRRFRSLLVVHGPPMLPEVGECLIVVEGGSTALACRSLP